MRYLLLPDASILLRGAKQQSGAGVGQDPSDPEAQRGLEYASGSSNGNGSSDGGWWSDLWSGVGDIFSSTVNTITGAATQRVSGLINPPAGTTAHPGTGAASTTPSWLWPVVIGGGLLIAFGALKRRR